MSVLTVNPGRAALEFERAALDKNITHWSSDLVRFRCEPDAVQDRRSWIEEAGNQLRQIEMWIAHPLDADDYRQQVADYDKQYGAKLFGKIFNHEPILTSRYSQK